MTVQSWISEMVLEILCVMLCLLHFNVFIHLHLASHLGTLDEPREGRDGGPIWAMEGLHKCCQLRCR